MLLRRGLALEHATLGWNVAGVAITSIAAHSRVAVAARMCGRGRWRRVSAPIAGQQ